MVVLRGARRILERDRPNLILELEDRHSPGIVAATISYLEPLGYHPSYLEHRDLRPLPTDRTAWTGLWNFVFTCSPA